MMEALATVNMEFAAKGWPRLEIGIGINAGPVVAGNLGSIKQLSYTVIGEEVNLASRLCSKASKGQILVSESVYRKVKWQFEMNRLEPITVKNVSHPVQVYEVTGIKATPEPVA
jgi:adenylate cyclase